MANLKFGEKCQKNGGVIVQSIVDSGPYALLNSFDYLTIGTGMFAFVDENTVFDAYLWQVIVKQFRNSPWYFMADNCPVHRFSDTEGWKQRHNILEFL